MEAGKLLYDTVRGLTMLQHEVFLAIGVIACAEERSRDAVQCVMNSLDCQLAAGHRFCLLVRMTAGAEYQ